MLSNDLDDFKQNHLDRINAVAKKKTEWIKEFVESQKPKKAAKTVGEMYKELNKKSLL